MKARDGSYEECPDCRGRGFLDPDDEKMCLKCGGTGMRLVKRQQPTRTEETADPWWDR